MPLQVVVDVGMIVALRALEITAQEDSAQVTRDFVHAQFTIKQETRGGARLFICTIRGQDLTDQYVPRLVLQKRLPQVILPGLGGHVLGSAALHQHLIEDILHSPCMVRGSQQCVDEARPLVRP